jgi:hypothetical protein
MLQGLPIDGIQVFEHRPALDCSVDSSETPEKAANVTALCYSEESKCGYQPTLLPGIPLLREWFDANHDTCPNCHSPGGVYGHGGNGETRSSRR